MRNILIAGLVLLASPAFSEPLDQRFSLESSVKSGKAKIYTQEFLPGIPVRVMLEGYCNRNETKDIDLYVFDSNGKLAAASKNPLCYEEVLFTPKDSGKHHILITNKKTPGKIGFELKIEADYGEPGEM